MDFALGVMADRVSRSVGRFGHVIVGLTLVSCLALLLLPLAAPRGMAWLFLGLTAVWAVTSSALRAPPLMLIGKHAARSAVPWLSALTLFGLGIASAIGPYLTLVLRDLDPRWPFALSSAALALATLGLVRVERTLAQRSAQPAAAAAAPATLSSRPVVWFVIAAALLAVGSQIHQFLNSPALYLRHAKPADLPYLTPAFWVGFNLLLMPAGFAVKRCGGLVVMGVAGVVAALASWLAQSAGNLTLLVAIQLVAGGAWGTVLASAVAAALAIGHTGREGTVTGALFSMLALAAAARIAIVAAELHKAAPYAAWVGWAPVVAWACAGALLLWLVSRQRRFALAASG